MNLHDVVITGGAVKQIVAPAVHLNGTSRPVLFETYEAACNHLRTALATLEDASPNARDYYMHEGAFERARAEHGSRVERVRDVLMEIAALMEAVDP